MGHASVTNVFHQDSSANQNEPRQNSDVMQANKLFSVDFIHFMIFGKITRPLLKNLKWKDLLWTVFQVRGVLSVVSLAFISVLQYMGKMLFGPHRAFGCSTS